MLSNARPLNSYSSIQQGQGVVDMSSMLDARTCNAPKQWNTIDWSTGTGSLELSRGTEHLIDGVVPLAGEMDIFGHEFDAPQMAAAELAQASWTGGVWNGNTWSGSTWSGNTWSGSTWSGNTWSGNTWSGSRHVVGEYLERLHMVRAARGRGSTWSGNTWSKNTWSSNRWSGNAWLGATWR